MLVFITGLPGAGKTTLIRKIADKLTGAVGFYTEEIRERGIRRGFVIKSLSGGERVLSHVDMESSHRVGKYGVDIEGFDEFVGGMDLDGASVVVIDEIGKMECLSAAFRAIIKRLVSEAVEDRTLIATIALKGTPFIEGIKKTHGARIFQVTQRNRSAMAREIAGHLAGGRD